MANEAQRAACMQNQVSRGTNSFASCKNTKPNAVSPREDAVLHRPLAHRTYMVYSSIIVLMFASTTPPAPLTRSFAGGTWLFVLWPLPRGHPLFPTPFPSPRYASPSLRRDSLSCTHAKGRGTAHVSFFCFAAMTRDKSLLPLFASCTSLFSLDATVAALLTLLAFCPFIGSGGSSWSHSTNTRSASTKHASPPYIICTRFGPTGAICYGGRQYTYSVHIL